jgi:hypothetical protein
MRNAWLGAAVIGTLVLGSCAPQTAPQSEGAMINVQGERVVIIKNPAGKSDAEYANEMATCEGYSRIHMEDKVNAYSGCMVHFDNMARVGCLTVTKSMLTSTPGSPPTVAGPNPWVPPGLPRQAITSAASAPQSGERWRCEEGMEININRSALVAELFSATFNCAIVITNGKIGPVGGNCPTMSGNPLLIYRQFVNPKGPLVEFGYEASSPGAAHTAKLGARYARYTVNTANGNLRASDGGRDLPSGKCGIMAHAHQTTESSS